MLPSLRTGRLDLDPTTSDDVDAPWSIWIEPDVRRHLWDDVPIGRETAAAAVARGEPFGAGGLGIWTIRCHREPRVIGIAGLTPVAAAARFESRLEGSVEVPICLSRSCRGSGLGEEALLAAMRHGFGTLRLPRLESVVDATQRGIAPADGASRISAHRRDRGTGIPSDFLFPRGTVAGARRVESRRPARLPTAVGTR